MSEEKPAIYKLTMSRTVTQGQWRLACTIAQLKGLIHDGMIKIGPSKTLRPGVAVTLNARMFSQVEGPLRKAEAIGLVSISEYTSKYTALKEDLKEELIEELKEELKEALAEGKSLEEAVEEAVEDVLEEAEPEEVVEDISEPEPEVVEEEEAPEPKKPKHKKGKHK